ncbi:MerR family transcriptional regulator [Nocardiopsis sp. CNT-189]|uniref:MerR family transcriptional regulator n=1 Tax=Nocardiopsis oceanisediminis TaxID=2816862 RepID=UPI003B2AE414
MTDFLTPSEAAARFGVSVDALRYYEREGLLPPVERDPGGRRRYRAGDLQMLELIRCLRDTGMPIARLREFAGMVREGDATIGRRADFLSEHDERLDARIAELRSHQRAIRHKIGYYRSVLEETAAVQAEGV